MSAPEGETAVVVFLRLPEKGKVKTRIAAVIGDDSALKIYQELIAITLDTLSTLTAPVYLYYDPILPPDHQRHARFYYRTQCRGDLGTKMADALSQVLTEHRSAVIIGSDCPGITPEILHASFQALRNNDIVIGPAEDGGYYLLGCHRLNPSLFHKIPWGGPTVFAETIHRIRQLGLQETLLRPLYDIDTVEDWTRFKAGDTNIP